jgi:hypothetical protein
MMNQKLGSPYWFAERKNEEALKRKGYFAYTNTHTPKKLSLGKRGEGAALLPPILFPFFRYEKCFSDMDLPWGRGKSGWREMSNFSFKGKM